MPDPPAAGATHADGDTAMTDAMPVVQGEDVVMEEAVADQQAPVSTPAPAPAPAPTPAQPVDPNLMHFAQCQCKQYALLRLMYPIILQHKICYEKDVAEYNVKLATANGEGNKGQAQETSSSSGCGSRKKSSGMEGSTRSVGGASNRNRRHNAPPPPPPAPSAPMTPPHLPIWLRLDTIQTFVDKLHYWEHPVMRPKSTGGYRTHAKVPLLQNQDKCKLKGKNTDLHLDVQVALGRLMHKEGPLRAMRKKRTKKGDNNKTVKLRRVCSHQLESEVLLKIPGCYKCNAVIVGVALKHPEQPSQQAIARVAAAHADAKRAHEAAEAELYQAIHAMTEPIRTLNDCKASIQTRMTELVSGDWGDVR